MTAVVERVTLELGQGDGWLARRPDGLFWTPADRRPDALLAAFLDATDGRSATTAVTSAVVAAAMAVDPFAIVTWSGDVHVVVMGSVEVCTDAPSMPMLSAGRSRTWVERRPGSGDIALTAGTPADDRTALDAGVVRGRWVPSDAVDVVDDHALTRRAVVRRAVSGGRSARTRRTAGPADGQARPDAAAVGHWRRLDGRFHRDRRSVGTNADATVTPAEPLERPAGALGAPMIVVDGTPAVELDDVVVIGRQPDPTAARVDAAAICCTVTGDAAVSRTHLVVRSGAAGVTVVDCGSRSGSALIAAGRQPQTMDPWTPYDLGTADAVRLGGSTTITISR